MDNAPAHPRLHILHKCWSVKDYRIYFTDPLQRRKQGVETVAAAFSDHFAGIIRMALDGISKLQKARVWRMNTSLLEESSFREIKE